MTLPYDRNKRPRLYLQARPRIYSPIVFSSFSRSGMSFLTVSYTTARSTLPYSWTIRLRSPLIARQGMLLW